MGDGDPLIEDRIGHRSRDGGRDLAA